MNYIQKLYTTLSYEFYNLTEFKFTKNYQANSKTTNRINENCLSVQVLPSSKTILTYIF